MKHAFLLIGGFLAIASGATQAQTLPAACMTSHASQTVFSQAGQEMAGYSARLTDTLAILQTAQVTIRDSSHRLTNSALSDANTVSALAALALLHGKLPDSCNNASVRPALRALLNDINAGAQPEITWRNATLRERDKNYTIRTIHIALHADHASGNLRVLANSEGISGVKGQFLPQTATTDITLPMRTLSESANNTHQDIALIRPGETMTINAMHATMGTSALDGHGTLQPGHSWADTQANMHLEIANLGDLLTQIHEKATAGVTTAIAMAQFMGHRDGNRVSWDVGMTQGTVSVNNVPLPIPLH
ncbi:hypothetical protein [Kozakia baliensis]|uniref:Uncharacterized protein n=1 Tax=Kozakia baliensis TaxID=153496 RepID=A0A1D8UTT0_9PROT|nr:hypothetical protein [Kozakia baliensis]AOX17054.1 hypothetical protein A0U89_07730 [Kozakia baliensis]GBR25048.1 hypothetical protein AA0488_0547 [Kozakia baliensis NRIC 0488]GEL63886.1 hypothetical protein KBA01_11720 [Kozakia baliensis]